MNETILIAAHDIAGARVVAAVASACHTAGYAIATLAHGPAQDVLTDDLVPERNALPEDILETLRPIALVTGTSATATIEPELWIAAQRLGIPSLAILDASINLRQRFVVSQPNVICVVDDESGNRLQSEEWRTAKIRVVGQPHLEHVANIIDGRRALPASNTHLVFFSEPIIASSCATRSLGYNQFSVAEYIVAALSGINGVSLTIKPHPNELMDHWRDWMTEFAPGKDPSINLETTDSLTLIARAHGVIGMASMALSEAAISGIPALALQPERRYSPRPALDADSSIRMVTRSDKVAVAVQEFVTRISDGDAKLVSSHRFSGSTMRVMSAIFETMGTVAMSAPREASS